MYSAYGFAILASNMSAADQPQIGGVVTGGGRSLFVSKQGAILIAGIIVGIALLGGATYLFVRYRPASTKTDATNTGIQQRTPAELITDAQSEVRTAMTAKEKATAYSHLGSAYTEDKQTTQAVNSYQTALSTAQDASDISNQALALSGLATTYMLAGDTANEIKAIEQLIPVLDQSTDPDDKRLAFRYQSLLDSLKAEQ